MEMEFLSTEGLSLWDPDPDLQLAAECLDWDYLSNDWVNTDEGRKLIDGTSKTNVENDEHLLLDDSELCDWMETKWDFEDGVFQLNSLDDINLLIEEDEDVKIEVTGSSCSASLLNTKAEADESQDEVEEIGSSCSASLLNTSAEAGESQDEAEDTGSSCSASLLSTAVEAEEVVRETRLKPYERPKKIGSKTEFRKSRKRSQNRTAATRYRIKKREEAEVLAEEEQRLLEANGELNKKVDDLSSEIRYLKGLLKEFVRAKRK